ncbi:hypothetical protein L1987_61092 [Smallanthus sonchifolius]|uniref:Uncharacterized protein n=1 Tax=Smallanthus sonchifolius TaxID=185202 RepID=A0ACB9D9V5_9ASTR|nr:hypothetical protein L1987_61092 [Smallanthus sonchifolius]
MGPGEYEYPKSNFNQQPHKVAIPPPQPFINSLKKPSTRSGSSKTTGFQKPSRRFANDDSSNGWERSRVGLSMDENHRISCNLRSKEKKTRNSVVRLEVRGHNYKWRSEVSNSMEEVHEFDAMEGHEDALDELHSFGIHRSLLSESVDSTSPKPGLSHLSEFI